MDIEYIKRKYFYLCNTHSDINEHLPILYKYATECNSVFETGVRGCVSSWAFALGLLTPNQPSFNTATAHIPARLLCNDITRCDIKELLAQTNHNNNLSISYLWKNNLDIDLEKELYNQSFDLLFIDTWHIYGQLKRELNKFHSITNKYIIMHDTTIDEIDGETIRCKWDAEEQSKTSGIPAEEINKGLGPAIDEFLNEHPEWILKEKLTNNNGLTVLMRV